MRVEHIRPFTTTAKTIIELLLSESVEVCGMGATKGMKTTQQVNTICGVSGAVEGTIIFSMSVSTADKVASRMLKKPVITFDAMAASALAELSNIICGNALSQLAQSGFSCNLAPPSVLRGSKILIMDLDIASLIIPLKLEQLGVIDLHISLRDRVASAA